MIKRVQIQNYRSIAKVVVDLGQFTVLVGPNGAGKSNFVDALSFVTDALSTTLTNALEQRGGINEVRRRSLGHPTNFGISLALELNGGHWTTYGFEVKSMPEGTFVVNRECCQIGSPKATRPLHYYNVEENQFTTNVPGLSPKVEPDRLGLTVVSAAAEFRPVYDALTQMRLYSIVPERVRALQQPSPERILRADGRNAATVLRELQRRVPNDYEQLCLYLSKVVPGVTKVGYKQFGPMESIEFYQDVGESDLWRFNALNMSDGTLRVLGILLAMYQNPAPSLVAIEEPEATIHPGAIGALVDILRIGQTRTQIIITTHSPEILNHKNIKAEQIRAVESYHGNTIISTLDITTKAVLQDKLYLPGELLAMGHLVADRAVGEDAARQLDLFPNRCE